MWSLPLALVLNACPSEDESSCPPDDGVQDDDIEFEDAECPADLPEMERGMLALGVGGRIRGELIDADKIPLGWYHNDWQVRFTGPDGEELSDVEITKADSWMPLHGHTGGQTPMIEPLDGEDGAFDVSGINITMKGPWQVRFDVTGGGVTDQVIFEVCNSEPKPVTSNACE